MIKKINTNQKAIVNAIKNIVEKKQVKKLEAFNVLKSSQFLPEFTQASHVL